jgi:hypothetical protein
VSDAAVVNTLATAGVARSATFGPDAGGATSEWFKRERYYTVQAVDMEQAILAAVAAGSAVAESATGEASASQIASPSGAV